METTAIEAEPRQVKFGKRTIGIIGGMGPEATADFYMRIVRIFQDEFHAKYDKDYPPMLIFSVPIPDVVETVESKSTILSYLTDAARTLESSGADFLCIPCNTVHMFLDAIRLAVKIPVLSIVEETAKKISGEQSPVGLLATRATIRAKTYENEFRDKQIALILPSDAEQETLTNVIMDVLSHTEKEAARARLREVVLSLRARGARSIVLACTELPLVVESDYDLGVIDPTDILARSCVELARS